MSDIVERMRQLPHDSIAPDPLCLEAADEIEQLRERCESYKGQVKAGADEIERLNKLVKQMARDSDAEFARLTGTAFDMRVTTIEECRAAARTVFRHDAKRSQAVDDAIRALAKGE